MDNSEKTLKILGKNIKYYRIQKKISQDVLAEKVDLSTRYISDIENGKGNIKISKLVKLADYFKLEPYSLLVKQDLPKLPKRVNMKK